MRYLILALLACSLIGCEMNKTTTPHSTKVEVTPK